MNCIKNVNKIKKKKRYQNTLNEDIVKKSEPLLILNKLPELKEYNGSLQNKKSFVVQKRSFK